MSDLDGFVKVRRGFIEHLAVLTGNEVKVFLALLLKADYNNGTARISVTDLCGMVGVAKSCVLPAIRELVYGEYITYKPASNQYGLSEFTIVKYDGAGISAGTGAGTCAGSESDLAPIPAQASDQQKQPLKNSRSKKKDIEEEKDERFDEFWKVYPRKKAKAAAITSFNAALKRGVDFDALLTGVKNYAASVVGKEEQFICFPKTFLTQDRYEDYQTSTAEPDEVDRYTGWF